MTVNVDGSEITYLGNGSTTTFTFPFSTPDIGSIHVLIEDSLGNITEQAPGAFSIVLNPLVGANPTSTGGTVTYPVVGSPLPVGAKIIISRQLARIQPVSLSNQSIIYPPVIERELDYLTMLFQGGVNDFGRAFKVGFGDPFPADVPPVSIRKSQNAFFDSEGNLTPGQVPGGTVFISAAMQPVVAAVNLAAARNLLGLGQLATLDAGLGLEVAGTTLRRNAPIRTITTNQTPTLSNHDVTDVTTGTLTYNLPASSGFFNGFGFYVNVNSGSATFVPAAGDHIQGLGSGVNWGISAGTTVNVQTDAAGVWYLRFLKTPIPTGRTITSGSGNYIPPLGVFRLRVQMCGGGAGGGFGGGTGVNGGPGGTSSFGGWTAIGGTQGQGSVGGTGGGIAPGASGGADGTGSLIVRVTGGDGSPGLIWVSPAEPNMVSSGMGGSSYFGGGGANTSNGNNPFSGRAPGTGGGGGANGGGGTGTGGGGSGGEYVSFWRNILSPTPISYVVGPGGAGQGPSFGAAGIIIVEEFYGGP